MLKDDKRLRYIDPVKYNYNDTVSFKIGNDIKTGYVYIIDKYGTFEQSEEPSYDIMVTEENCLYKHIRQSWII